MNQQIIVEKFSPAYSLLTAAEGGVILARLLILISLVFSFQVIAIDEDYYIPYTDNYGYVYDPETGQFIKQDQGSTESENPSAPESAVNSAQTSGNIQSVTETSTDTDGTSSFTMVIIGLIVVAVIGFIVWSRRKKQVY